MDTGSVDVIKKTTMPYAESKEKGMMSENLSLGMAYVPFQSSGMQMYPEKKGLKHGTLYEALDFPFKNMPNNDLLEETPLNMLIAAGFALDELALYLDTHPNDSDAITLYNRYWDTYNERKMAYEREYGPITKGKNAGQFYNWIKNPWPWEMK